MWTTYNKVSVGSACGHAKHLILSSAAVLITFTFPFTSYSKGAWSSFHTFSYYAKLTGGHSINVW